MWEIFTTLALLEQQDRIILGSSGRVHLAARLYAYFVVVAGFARKDSATGFKL